MTVAEAQEQKKLNTQLKKLQGEKEAAQIELNGQRTKILGIDQQILKIKKRIKVLEKSSQDPTVTEHAMLRYIERVLKIDLKDIESRILTPEVKPLVKTLNTGKFPIEGGKIVVKNNVVVTVEPINKNAKE